MPVKGLHKTLTWHNLAGCVWLLQVWMWIRLPIGRPTWRNHPAWPFKDPDRHPIVAFLQEVVSSPVVGHRNMVYYHYTNVMDCLQPDHKFSSEEVEDILLHWTFDPNYRLPGNVYAIDLYTKDCFEDLEQYSQDGVACFVLQLTCIRNGTFNRRMGKKNYGWIQCDKGKEERLIKKTFKYVEKFDSKKLTTNLKRNYMADRRMKEYTFESGPEDKVFCVVTSPEWCQASAPPSASSPAPSSQKEIEKLMTELRLVRDERDIFEREVVNLRSEIQRLKDDQREEVKALELKLASCDAKLKRSELTKMEIATEYEKQKRLLQSMQLQIEASEQLRKELHNTIIELKGNIRVLYRVRPLLPNETGAISFPKNEESIGRGVVVSHNARTYSFTFDRVFGPTSSQEAVFSEISEVVQSALDGYKVCIFAYGQSGSGKTHTMMGNPEEIGGKGLIPRSLEQIFQTSKALNSNGWKYVIKVKMVEIYNDSICDLLGSNSTTNLTTVVVSDVNEVFHHLKQAAKRRYK